MRPLKAIKRVSPEFARARIANSRMQLAFVIQSACDEASKADFITYWLMANLEAWDSLEADGTTSFNHECIPSPLPSFWAAYLSRAREFHGH